MKYLLIIALFALVFADTVVLKGGKEVDGNIVSMSPMDVQIRSDKLLYIYKRSDVKSIIRDKSAKKYLRHSNLTEEFNGVETCSKIFVNTKTGKCVTLVGVVHVGDKDYYSKLQTILDCHDVVLYEAIGRVAPNPDLEEWIPTRNLWDKSGDYDFSCLSSMQIAMAFLLDLEFQLSSINYNRDFWFNADMSELELIESYRNRKVEEILEISGNSYTFDFDIYLNVAKHIAKFGLEVNKDNFKFLIKNTLGKTLSDNILHEAKTSYLKSIIIDRNKKAFESLDQLSKNKNVASIAIFYGSAHMYDMEKMLLKRGFTIASEFWDIAWKIKIKTQ